MLPFADGSDLAASLRNPGNYCNVVGFRPDAGTRAGLAGSERLGHAVGARARSRARSTDAAFLLSGMAGPDPRAPVSITEPGSILRKAARAGISGKCASPGRAISAACRWTRASPRCSRSRSRCSSPGLHRRGSRARISPARPRPSRRCARSPSCRRYGALYSRTTATQLKDTVVWNIEQGLRARRRRRSRAPRRCARELFHRMRAFLERYEFLLCPVNQLPPFPVDAGIAARRSPA